MEDTLARQSTAQVVALIYARVSDRKQLEGSGLQSQEHRGRQHAEAQGIPVEKVFLDVVSGGKNDIFDRPAMHEILCYLDSQRLSQKRYVVIFDDHKRFARLTEMHLRLRREFAERGALIQFLNLNTEDTPEGRFTEIIFAAQAQLEREQNKRQSYDKTKARLEQGYWTRRAPRGYRYVRAKGGGKELVRDEPIASIVQEALEGYANGRFSSATEVRRFLERQPEFPGEKANGELHKQTVPRMFKQKLYAGYLEAVSWGVPLRKAKHEPIISFETFQRIQAKANQRTYAPMRKDLNEDFPLRGAVACSECGDLLTAAWSKGKYKHYAYYRCQNTTCSERNVSIPRQKVEGPFAELLTQLTPTKELFELARMMFDDLWSARLAQAGAQRESIRDQVRTLDKELEALVARAVEATSSRVITAYEKRIASLEMQKLVLAEKADKKPPKARGYRELIELSLQFLENPRKLWDSGHYGLRRTVLKLAVTGPMSFNRKEGLLNTEFAMPFKALAGFSGQKTEMVPRERIELSASSLPMTRSTTELPRLLFKTRAYRWVRLSCQAKLEALLEETRT